MIRKRKKNILVILIQGTKLISIIRIESILIFLIQGIRILRIIRIRTIRIISSLIILIPGVL